MANDFTVNLIAERKHLGGKYTYYENLVAALSSSQVRFSEVVYSNSSKISPQKLMGYLSVFSGNYKSNRVLQEIKARAGEVSRLKQLNAGPMIFHTQHPIDTVAILNSAHFKAPIIQTVHSFWLDECLAQGLDRNASYFRMLEEVQESALEKTSLFITLNKLQTERLVSNGVHKHRVMQIPNTVDAVALCENRTCFKHDRKYFVIVSRLSPEKGIEVAIAAMGKLESHQMPDLLIVGDGPSRRELEAIVHSKNLGGRVKFLGAKSHKEAIAIMRGAELLLCPSVPYGLIEDSAPLSVLEAMAVGTPVAASRIGGIPEYVDHGETGYLFFPTDSDALAAVLKFHFDGGLSLRGRMSDACAKKLSSYDFEGWTRDILSAYRHALVGV